MFPGYEQYKRETPMLIPTRESIARCIKTLRGVTRPVLARQDTIRSERREQR
jgi:hypothetical protein